MASPPTSWQTCRTSLGKETLQTGGMPAPIVKPRRLTSALQGTVLRHVHERRVAGPVLRCVQHSLLRLHTSTRWPKTGASCAQLGQCLGGPSKCALPTDTVMLHSVLPSYSGQSLPCREPLVKHYWFEDVFPVLCEIYETNDPLELDHLAHEWRLRRYPVISVVDQIPQA